MTTSIPTQEPSTGAALRTSAVAEAAGVNRQTLRYYHRRGLLAEPARSPGGHRLYPPETVGAIRMIKAAQRLGFTLREIAELLKARQRLPSGQADDRLRRYAVAKVAELDARVSDLRAVRAELADAISAAEAGHGACSCGPHCPLPLDESCA